MKSGGEALADLRDALASPWLWTVPAWSDIRQRFSGSVLGSLWLTANIALIAAALTFIFGGGGGAAYGYAAYVTIGLVLWYFMQSVLNEAASLYPAVADVVRSSAMPLSAHILRLVWRNLIVLAHTAVVVPVVLILAGRAPSASAWTVAPALIVLVLATASAGTLAALLGARFRDVPQLVVNGMQLLFFLTPVFWTPSALAPHRLWFVAANPAFALIDIVRSPLLGAAPAASSWPVALAAAALAALAAAAAFAACRTRIAYWV